MKSTIFLFSKVPSEQSLFCTGASNQRRLEMREQTAGLTRFHGWPVLQTGKNTADQLWVAAPALILLFFFLSPLSFPWAQEERKDRRGSAASRKPFPLQKISSPNSSTSPTLTSTRSPPRSDQEAHSLMSSCVWCFCVCRNRLRIWGAATRVC